MLVNQGREITFALFLLTSAKNQDLYILCFLLGQFETDVSFSKLNILPSTHDERSEYSQTRHVLSTHSKSWYHFWQKWSTLFNCHLRQLIFQRIVAHIRLFDESSIASISNSFSSLKRFIMLIFWTHISSCSIRPWFVFAVTFINEQRTAKLFLFVNVTF
jgi:hypothetical protein